MQEARGPMTQSERRRWLIEALLQERPDGEDIRIPADETAQRRLLRALFNLRPPMAAAEGFLRVQGACLREELARKGVTDAGTLQAVGKGIYLWQGDITTLRADAIVNAGETDVPGEIRARSVALRADIDAVLRRLRDAFA